MTIVQLARLACIFMLLVFPAAIAPAQEPAQKPAQEQDACDVPTYFVSGDSLCWERARPP
jgi:hypothetical protein